MTYDKDLELVIELMKHTNLVIWAVRSREPDEETLEMMDTIEKSIQKQAKQLGVEEEVERRVKEEKRHCIQ